jgi:hypothetical protein
MSPWDKREGEPDKAFGALEVYLESSKFERSDVSIASLCGVQPSTIFRWARDYEWAERARAWDSAIVDSKHEIIKEHQSARYLKRIKDRIKAEEKASEALEGCIDVLIEIYIDEDVAPNHRIAAIRELKLLTHIDDVDLSKQITERSGTEALALEISEDMKVLNDEEAATLRLLLEKMRLLNG